MRPRLISASCVTDEARADDFEKYWSVASKLVPLPSLSSPATTRSVTPSSTSSGTGAPSDGRLPDANLVRSVPMRVYLPEGAPVMQDVVVPLPDGPPPSSSLLALADESPRSSSNTTLASHVNSPPLLSAASIPARTSARAGRHDASRDGAGLAWGVHGGSGWVGSCCTCFGGSLIIVRLRLRRQARCSIHACVRFCSRFRRCLLASSRFLSALWTVVLLLAKTAGAFPCLDNLRALAWKNPGISTTLPLFVEASLLPP